MIHSTIWILWLILVMTFTLATRNPVYLIILLSSLFLLGNKLASKNNFDRWFMSNLKFILTMILLSTLINALFAHVGSTILITIPRTWPLVGGNITLESMIYGAINGLIIGALFLLFNIINLALSIKQITRLIPRAFAPVAMTVTIALTFFPSIQQRTREIKEAQMIRGNPMKNMTDWLPILIPLLVSSLENAIQLAESMTARGFHKQTSVGSPFVLVSFLIAAFTIFSGWILQIYQYPSWIYFSLFILGFGLTGLTLLMIGNQSKTTRYQQEPWRSADVITGSIITLLIVSFVFLVWRGHLASLDYSPYPRLTPPILQLIAIFYSLVPILPVFILQND